MEKNRFNWFKTFLKVFIPLAVILCLSLQTFADFAGDGITAPGGPLYSQSGVDFISISQTSGGGSSAIDSITYSPIPMFQNGSLQSEVSRGVYGAASDQYYRYTTQITRGSGGTISQKAIFDSPLFNTASQLSVYFHIPIVTDNSFDFVINAVTDNTSGTCRIMSTNVSYQETFLVPSRGEESVNVSTFTTSFTNPTDTASYSFPYTFEFSQYLDYSNSIISDVVIEFDILVISSGSFSLSFTDEYDTMFGVPPIISDEVDNVVVIEPVYIEEIPLAEAIVNSFSDIAEIELFGVFSISDILWAFVGILCLIAFLKLYAGG